MKGIKKIYWVYFLGGALGILIPDLVTKYLAVKGVFGDYVLIRGILYLVSYQKNAGIAFGINLPMWIQIAGSGVILLLLIIFGFECVFSEKPPCLIKLSFLGMIVGGGFGNLLGRVFNGYVVDFIVLRPFPVFNLADIGITVGIILLFGTMILFHLRCKKNK